MPNRTERRAAEHAARKLANKLSRQQVDPIAQFCPAALGIHSETRTESETGSLARTAAETQTISAAQLEANRANAQKSPGPRSDAGKAKSSQNALKHGLAGRFAFLPGEDAEEYEHTLAACFDAYKPATEEEERLAQSMNECTWRVTRLQYLEAAIMLKGNIEFAEKFEDRTSAERRLLIQAETYLKYEKSIRNLHIQEARLLRTREKAQAELTCLQTIRRRQEMLAPVQATQPQPAASPDSTANENGFVFSTDQNRTAAAPGLFQNADRRAA